MRHAAYAICSLVLAACADAGSPPAQTPTCSAQDGYESLVGKSADVLASMTFPSPVRIIRQGMPVTTDFHPERLNIEIDDKNRISRVWCG